MTCEFGPWEPLTIDEVVEVMASTGLRWWFTGGHALEMHLGRSWREHDDIDVGVCRRDLGALVPLLDEWEIHVAAAGELRRWDGGALTADRHENNLWVRRPDGPWCLDVAVGDGDDARWVYRRDPSLRLSWAQAVRTTSDGLAYLDPALQLLFKSTGLRLKDHLDATEVLPELDDWGTALLDVRLRGDHPWRSLIESRRRPLAALDAVELVDGLCAAGVTAWVDGGWGIDALLGEQTRPHADLDLALPTRQWASAHEVLRAQGFDIVRHDGPHNSVLLGEGGRLVDLHAFDDTTTLVGDDGVERYGPDGLAYEVDGFGGVGSIAGRQVACMTAAFQMGSHTGYEVDDGDWHDVRLLHQRFGLAIPADYRSWTGSPDEPS